MNVQEATQALADAQATLARWMAEAEEKTRIADAATAAQVEAEVRSGVDVLDGADPVAEVADNLIRLSVEQDVAHRAAMAAQDRVGAAQRRLLTARGDELGARAAHLQELAAVRAARTRQMLDELNAFEQTIYYLVSPLLVTSMNSPTPRTQRIERHAAWLASKGEEYRRIAADGDTARVAAEVQRPMPEVNPIERDALADLQAV